MRCTPFCLLLPLSDSKLLASHEVYTALADIRSTLVDKSIDDPLPCHPMLLLYASFLHSSSQQVAVYRVPSLADVDLQSAEHMHAGTFSQQPVAAPVSATCPHLEHLEHQVARDSNQNVRKHIADVLISHPRYGKGEEGHRTGEHDVPSAHDEALSSQLPAPVGAYSSTGKYINPAECSGKAV
jgi:hypothetical protein